MKRLAVEDIPRSNNHVQQNKTVALAIETVAAAVVGNRKQCKKLQNALKNKQNRCKTVALAIETVAAAVDGNRK